MKPSRMVIVLGIACALTSCGTSGAVRVPDPEPAPQTAQARPVPSPDHAPRQTAGTGEVPKQVRSLVDPHDTLLAYKAIHVTDGMEPDVVMIVRHPVPVGAFSYSENPCELLVFRRSSGSYTITGRSAKAVDCTNINFSREMARQPDDLNEYLTTGSNSITYVNQYTKSTSIYSFEYSKERSQWFLASATNNYPRMSPSEGRIQNVTEKIQYPHSIGFVTMREFDPTKLADAFEKNRIIH